MKTYSETRSTAEKEIRIEQPVHADASFVVISGPSGSGRHAYAAEKHTGATVLSAHVELEKICGDMYKCGSNWEIIAAYRERNQRIKEATQKPCSYVIICEEPSAIKRRLFTVHLRAPVVIVNCERLRDATFYSRLSLDIGDKIVYT